MRGKWSIDEENRITKRLNCNAVKRRESQRNIIEYRYRPSGISIEMKHFVRANVFALETNKRISGIPSERAYSIIKKWRDTDHSDALEITGDVQDIQVDDLFAGGKIEL